MAQGFVPPALAPDLLAKQLRMQQQQQMAGQFMQDASQPLQGQMVSGHYVAPNWTQQLAQGLKGALGTKIMMDAPRQMADMQGAQQQRLLSMFGMGGQAAPSDDGAQTFPVSGQPSPQALAQGLSGGQQSPQQGGSMLPGIPGMSREQQALIASQIGLPEYLKLAAKQGGPINVAPGGTVFNPATNQVQFVAPKDGIAINNGVAQAVPGFSDIAARNAGMETAATEGAKAKFDLVDVPDGQGGTVKMPRAQALQVLGGSQPQGQSVPAGGGLGHEPPKRVIEARQELPKVVSQADQMINSIDGILNHPGLESGVGASSYLPSIRGTDRADFDVRSAQLKGQAFLQAFESLKGGGQITEVEGKAATEAIARLDNAQSEQAYKASLMELRGILETAKARAFEKAGTAMPAGSAAPEQRPAPAPQLDRNALMQEARRRGLIK